MGLRDFVKQQKEEQQAQLAADAAESLHVEKHPLSGTGADFIDLYVKSILIFRSELPLEYPDPEEGKKQLRLFARSLGLTREQQSELEQEVSFYDDQAKTETLLELSSRDNAEAMTCFMCDAARLHGAGYKFEGEFADFWRDTACGIAKLSREQAAAAEKLCRDIIFGLVPPSAEQYPDLPKTFVSYFGQPAFAEAVSAEAKHNEKARREEEARRAKREEEARERARREEEAREQARREEETRRAEREEELRKAEEELRRAEEEEKRISERPAVTQGEMFCRIKARLEAGLRIKEALEKVEKLRRS